MTAENIEVIREFARHWAAMRANAIEAMGEHGAGVRERDLLEWAFQSRDSDGETLLEWVRLRMVWLAGGLSRWEAGGELAVADAIAKDIGIEQGLARSLCELAG